MSLIEHLETLLRHLPDLVQSYGLIAVFVVILLESAGIPMPGETMLIAAAVFAGTGKGPPVYWIILVAACAAILGDNIGFWVGRRFGLRLLLRYGPKVRLDERKLKLGQYLFMRHGGKIVFFGRFVALLRTFAAVLAGANNYDPRRFMMFNAAGGIVWATIFGLGGYAFGTRIEDFAGSVGIAALALAAVFVIAGLVLARRHEGRLADEAEAAIPGPLAERIPKRRRNDAEQPRVRTRPQRTGSRT